MTHEKLNLQMRFYELSNLSKHVLKKNCLSHKFSSQMIRSHGDHILVIHKTARQEDSHNDRRELSSRISCFCQRITFLSTITVMTNRQITNIETVDILSFLIAIDLSPHHLMDKLQYLNMLDLRNHTIHRVFQNMKCWQSSVAENILLCWPSLI